jgi:hypothetical protein
LKVLKVRKGAVSVVDPLVVRIGEEERPAWADRGLGGEVKEGDEVIVNVEARDLGLGSGGFDGSHMGRSIDEDRLFFAAALVEAAR